MKYKLVVKTSTANLQNWLINSKQIIKRRVKEKTNYTSEENLYKVNKKKQRMQQAYTPVLVCDVVRLGYRFSVFKKMHLPGYLWKQ